MFILAIKGAFSISEEIHRPHYVQNMFINTYLKQDYLYFHLCIHLNIDMPRQMWRD